MPVWATEGVEVYKDLDRAVGRQQGHECWYFVQDDGKTILGDTALSKLKQLELWVQGKWKNIVLVIRKMFIIKPTDRITAQNLTAELSDPSNPI
jgi:hypothetical protein